MFSIVYHTSMTKELLKFWLKHPSRFLATIILHFGSGLSDSLFLKIKYYEIFGKRLNLKHPKTFNEKLQWLKLYDRKPEYTIMVDKVEAKKWVADRIGERYIIPTLGVWDKAEDIDFDSLPNKFVLKTNHDSGAVIICKDKSKLNFDEARKRLDASLKSDFYKSGREWPYKNVKRKILAEEFLGENIEDYKFFCYKGFPESVMVCCDRQLGETKYYFFDQTWTLKRYNTRGKKAPADFSMPHPLNIKEMFEIASILSKANVFVRVDLYNIEGKIYFGEMTFFPTSGFDPNLLPETDKYFGQLINLPSRNENNRLCNK